MRRLALLIAAFLLFLLAFHTVVAQEIAVMQGVVVVKTRADAPRATLSGGPSALRTALESLGASQVEPLIRDYTPAWSALRKAAMPEAQQRAEAEVARIQKVRYSAPVSPWDAARLLAAVPGVEYAEPYFLFEPLGGTKTPNDSLFSSQAYMKLIKAEEAWDVSEGDTTVVVAVADTDVKWDHPDLEPNIWINPGEDGRDGQGRDKRSNGVDDDGNGMKDDWHGWDFGGADNATPDNDTRSAGGGHGTSVAGLVGTATNNRIGIASIGYKCRILPIKIGADAGGNLAFGYDAIPYAQRLGARVFNASWGSAGYSKALEDVVNAAVAGGMVIVGGAGNHGAPTPFYPASYPAVLDAGVCNAQDVIGGGSGYGPPLDVVCPADGALSTNVGNTYSPWGSVTSAAAPMASGLCALVASHFKTMTAEQIRERVRVTCDNIDAQNPSRAKYAGKGRINALRALTDPAGPSLRIQSFTVADPNNDKRLDPGESVGITVVLKNYLDATSGPIQMTLVPVTNAASVDVTESAVSVPALAAGATGGNAAQPFRFTVRPSSTFDATVLFRIDISSGTYEDFDFVSVIVNPSYQDMRSGQLMLTVFPNGMLGFGNYPDNTLGNGMKYAGTDAQLYLGSVLAGTDAGHVVGNARSAGNFLARDNDLRLREGVTIVSPAGLAATRATSRFTASGADSARRLPIDVRHEMYDFSNRGFPDMLVSKYTVTNTGTEPVNGLRFGLFMDFGGYPQYYIGHAAYDSTLRFGTITKTGWPTVGSFVIDSLPDNDPRRASFWAINNDHRVTAGNPFGTLDGFTAAEKWRALSSFAGNRSTTDGNLAYVLSGPTADIAPGASAVFVFGHVVGTNMGTLKTRVEMAQAFWRNPPVVGTDGTPALPVALRLLAAYPQPVSASRGGVATLVFEQPLAGPVAIDVYTLLGTRVAGAALREYPAGLSTGTVDLSGLARGLYIIRLSGGAHETRAPLMLTD